MVFLKISSGDFHEQPILRFAGIKCPLVLWPLLPSAAASPITCLHIY